MTAWRRPGRLRPGDRVAVIAPAGPVPRPAFERGAALLGARYRLVFDEPLFSVDGFLAGDDRRRLAELERALADPELRAIFCARGGYGVMRLLASLDLSPLVRDPRPLVGFSDITALHAALARTGLVSVHGPVLTQLAELPAEDFETLVQLLERPEPPPPWLGLTPLHAAPAAAGPLVGGNLELLTRLLGTPYLPPLDGAVLVLEEIGERPYRVDRALTQLELAGVFARVAAVVVGDFVRCDPVNGQGPGAEEVVRERLGRLPIPVLLGAPVGHGTRNRPFAHGARAVADPAQGSLHFLEGAVD